MCCDGRRRRSGTRPLHASSGAAGYHRLRFHAAAQSPVMARRDCRLLRWLLWPHCFVNPPHGFSIEDNLAYRDYILLHQRAEEFAEARYPMAKVLTAWPASDELTRPYLGYVTRPMRVFRIEDFSAEQIVAAADLRSDFDLALVFSTKYEPPHPWFERWRKWQQWKTEFFGYHRDVPPDVAAQVLGGRLVYLDVRHGQWIGVIEMERIEEARVYLHGPTQ